MIRENSLWAQKVEDNDYFVYDIWDSLNQGKRIFTRPLIADNNDVRSFGSLEGRKTAILYLAKSICREPFRFLKHLIVIVAEIAKTALDILNFAFWDRVRANIVQRIKHTLKTIAGLCLRPIAFAFEIFRYLGAILVHPWLAMRLADKPSIIKKNQNQNKGNCMNTMPTIRDLDMPTSLKSQFENLIKPTLTTKEQGWDKFGSLSGRGVCLVRMADYALNVPFRFFQAIALIAFSIINVFRYLLTLPFAFQTNKAKLKENFYMFVNQTANVLLMPLSAPMDLTKLALGAIVHPAAAIEAPRPKLII